MNKKGLSVVISSIILILIVVSAVSLIFAYSSGLFLQQKDYAVVLSPEYQKLGISIDSVTLNPNEAIIIVSRTDNEGENIPIKGLRFKFTNKNGESYSYDVAESSLEAGESKTYNIPYSSLGVSYSGEMDSLSLNAISPQGKQTQTLDEKQLG